MAASSEAADWPVMGSSRSEPSSRGIERLLHVVDGSGLRVRPLPIEGIVAR